MSLGTQTVVDRPRMAWPLVGALALAKVAFHLATAAMYGLHRDEFYYLADGRRLSFGYVDHPILTPLFYRIGELLFGDSQVGLRVMPALLGGGLVVLGALLARELGGGRFAQGLTGLVALLGPLYLTTSHFLGTVSFDLLAWSAGTLLVIRIIRTGDTRLWLAVGAVVGVGLMNKHTVLFWVAGMGIGLLATPQRKLLFNRWILLGGGLALLLFLPNIVWQVKHDWATLTFLGNLRRRLFVENMTQFVPIQLGLVTLAGTAVVVAGLRWLLRGVPATANAPGGAAPAYRSVAIAYLVIFVMLFVLGGKGYYLGSMYLPLVAAGSVAIERFWSARGRIVVATAVVVTGLISAPLFTPIVPASALRTVKLQNLNADLGGLLGWHDVARTVAGVYHSLPPAEQARAVIFTSNYSEAGSVNYYRASLGVPPAISGHNNFWIWGPGNAQQGIAVVVGFSRSYLSRYFGDIQQAAVLGQHIELLDKQEVDKQVWICRQQFRPWPEMWPELQQFG